MQIQLLSNYKEFLPNPRNHCIESAKNIIKKVIQAAVAVRNNLTSYNLEKISEMSCQNTGVQKMSERANKIQGEF